MVLLDLILRNPEVSLMILQQGLFAAGAAVCEVLGWSKASKVLGTLTTLDLGRVVRYGYDLKLKRVTTTLLVLAILGCSGQTPAKVREVVSNITLPACDILQDVDSAWLAEQLHRPVSDVEAARDACPVIRAVDQAFASGMAGAAGSVQ